MFKRKYNIYRLHKTRKVYHAKELSLEHTIALYDVLVRTPGRPEPCIIENARTLVPVSIEDLKNAKNKSAWNISGRDNSPTPRKKISKTTNRKLPKTT